MVFDVEDKNCSSSACDEGARQHRCEAGAEITSSKVDNVVVKIRSRCGALFDGECQGQRVQVKRKRDRITAQNERVGSQSLWSMAKKSWRFPSGRRHKQNDTGGSPRRSLIDSAREVWDRC